MPIAQHKERAGKRLFYGDETVGNKVGKECSRAVGADKIAFEFLKTEGEALHIFFVCALTVETAACAKLVKEVCWRGGDNFVAILQPVGC